MVGVGAGASAGSGAVGAAVCGAQAAARRKGAPGREGMLCRTPSRAALRGGARAASSLTKVDGRFSTVLWGSLRYPMEKMRKHPFVVSVRDGAAFIYLLYSCMYVCRMYRTAVPYGGGAGLLYRIGCGRQFRLFF